MELWYCQDIVTCSLSSQQAFKLFLTSNIIFSDKTSTLYKETTRGSTSGEGGGGLQVLGY